MISFSRKCCPVSSALLSSCARSFEQALPEERALRLVHIVLLALPSARSCSVSSLSFLATLPPFCIAVPVQRPPGQGAVTNREL